VLLRRGWCVEVERELPDVVLLAQQNDQVIVETCAAAERHR
jgi:hypothetical protein